MYDRSNGKCGVRIMLMLYTQDRCGYCDILKKKLTAWGQQYVESNIMYDPKSKTFIQNAGHKTVPQLYYDGRDMLKGESTDLTQDILIERMDESWGERPELSF
jgi:glutaredoxin